METDSCLYNLYSGLHGQPTEPCGAARVLGLPYCLEHAHRVTWLSFGVRVVRVRAVAWWAVLGLLLLGVLLGAYGGTIGEVLRSAL